MAHWREAIPGLEDVGSVFPKVAEQFGELCSANGIVNPPQFKIVREKLPKLGINEDMAPHAVCACDSIVMGESFLRSAIEGNAHSPYFFLSHELGHILRRDIKPPGVIIPLVGRIDVKGASKAMEHNTDGLGAHIITNAAGGDKNAGMNMVRYSNNLLANTIEHLGTLGKKGQRQAASMQEMNKMHYGAPAQRFDNVRRALRHDAEELGSQLERLIEERNAGRTGIQDAQELFR